MTELRDFVTAEYAKVLYAYVSQAEEASLERAHHLGRTAIANGLGLLDMIAIHQEAIQPLQGIPDPEARQRMVNAAGAFLVESLVAFEVLLRGFREASSAMDRVLQFSEMLCHELRSPLTSVIASTGLLAEELAPAPESTEAKLLNNISAGARALKTRMDDMVDTAGFQSGALTLQMEPVQMRPFLQEIAERLRPEANRAGIDLQLDMPEDLPAVQADGRRLEQVMINLVQNAIKYAAEGKRVRIGASAGDGRLEVMVSDHGKGISAEDQKKLFQPQFRVKRYGARGLGIGLALCKQIITAHGGEIWVKTEPGSGSAFHFSLPLLRTLDEGRSEYEVSRNRRFSGSHRNDQALPDDPLGQQ
ncbi:MAG: HAMP domain-containing sensor histidine kinase [Thermaerobacterales bacterium]